MNSKLEVGQNISSFTIHLHKDELQRMLDGIEKARNDGDKSVTSWTIMLVKGSEVGGWKLTIL